MNKSSFLIVGQHAVIEALRNPKRKVLKVFLTEESKKNIHRKNPKKNVLEDVKVYFKSKKELDKYTSKDQMMHGGYIAEVEHLDQPELKEFIKGSELMLKYKTFKTPIDAIFDLKKAAKIYALYDLGKIRHSYHWHNQRFYFNPSLNKLEHIAFDCYAGLDEGIEDVIYGYTTKETSHYNSVYLTKQLFNDSNFVSLYKEYLQQFSNEKFVKKIDEKHKLLCDSLSGILKNEFPNYEFNLNYLYENAKAIRDTLQVYDTTFHFNSYDINYDYNSIGNNYFNSIGLKAIIKEEHLELKNFHLDTLKVIGYSSTSKVDEMIRFNSTIVLSPYRTRNDFARIEVNKEIKYLFFLVSYCSIVKIVIYGVFYEWKCK